jgi:hypothetical protein
VVEEVDGGRKTDSSVTASVNAAEDVDFDHDPIRPSEVVVDVNESGEVCGAGGLCLLKSSRVSNYTTRRTEIYALIGLIHARRGTYKVSVTGISFAGLPMLVSRTWHVIGGLVAVAMVVTSGLGEFESWFERAWRREVEEGMRVPFVLWPCELCCWRNAYRASWCCASWWEVIAQSSR